MPVIAGGANVPPISIRSTSSKEINGLSSKGASARNPISAVKADHGIDSKRPPANLGAAGVNAMA
jgi:hypothetical protein